MLKRAIPVGVIAVLLAGLLVWSQQRAGPTKVSGVIEADEIRLGSRVGGRVKNVLVEEGMPVAKGDPLVTLEPYDLEERLAQAQALAEQNRQLLAKMNAGFRDEEIAQAKARHDRFVALVDRMERPPRDEEVAAARARIKQANAQLELAQQSQQRLLDLYERQPQAVPQDQRDRAAEEVKVSLASVEVRQEELKILLAGTREEERREARAQRDEALAAWQLAKDGFRDEEIAEAEAALQAAEASVSVIEKQIEELTIRSQVDGIVEAMELQPGDPMSAGGAAMSVMDTGRLWVRAYVPQGQLQVQLGQRLDVTVDAYPDERFTGEVTFVSRQAEFTPSNVQTFEERAKQMFRIKVTLELPNNRNSPEEVKLRPGMTADVWLKISES